MAKVVLIYPNFDPPVIYKKNDVREGPGIPLGILSIASFIKKNKNEVKIIDTRIIEGNVFEKIIEECKNAALVGISAMTAQVKDGIKISRLIKEKTSAKVIWGGIHSTLFPVQTCENQYIDFVVVGEGEEAIMDLLVELKKKKSNFEKIRGLVFKKQGNVIQNLPRPAMNMDELPYLDYDILELKKYFLKILPGSEKKVKTLPLETSRGCPHRCAFCFHVIKNDRQYRSKSVSRIIKELKNVYETYGIQMIGFAEDNFFVNRNRVKAILTEIINKNIKIKWIAECRADYFKKGHVDEELLGLMKKSGCVELEIGAESGSQKILNMLKKDITVDDIINSAKLCKKYDILPSYGFITGIPEESITDAKKTANLIRKIKQVCPKSFGGITIFRPYPGGELYSICMKTGKLKTPEKLEDWSKDQYIFLMVSGKNKIPWNKHEKFMLNFAHYTNLYFFSNSQLLRYVKQNMLLGAGYSLLVLLARVRFKMLFFFLPVDKWVYEKALKILKYDL